MNLQWSGRVLLVAWIVAGGVMLLTLGTDPLQRTQEARVLVTAREMADGLGMDWLVPQMNGATRLQKPPLAYWLSATSFMVFGIKLWAGRLPMMLAAWATLGLTYAWANHLAGRRAGILAALSLLGTLFFFHFAHQAETDTLAMPFVTGGIYFFWRALRLPTDQSIENAALVEPSQQPLHAGLWHLAAACIGLAVMAKGGPAAYPIIFLLASVVIFRRYRSLWNFVKCGAPLTALAIALPWFILVWKIGQFRVLNTEIYNLSEGTGHPGWFYDYIPMLLVDTLPWTPFVFGAIIFGIRRWKRDPVMRGLIIAASSIFLPLFVIGQKQNHYLLTVMPILMILLAVTYERLLQQATSFDARLTVFGLRLTALALVLAPMGMVLTTFYERNDLAMVDFWPPVVILIIALYSLKRILRGGLEQMGVFAAASLILVVLLQGVWSPRLETTSPARAVKILTKRFGPSSFAFYQTRPSLPLVFELGKDVPIIANQSQLQSMPELNDNTLLLYCPGRTLTADATPPPSANNLMTLTIEDKPWQVFTMKKSSPSPVD